MPGFAAFAEPWWVPVLYIIVVGHVSNLCVTLYLHRSATHEGVKFAPPVEHFMRAWLWLTTGMNTKEWVAVHRKHHAYADREGDPHSPHTEGLLEIVCGGVFFYREEAKNAETLEKYGRGCPEDAIEMKLYTPRPAMGILIMLFVDVFLFGIGWGLIAWACMAVWIPIFGNVINGVGHHAGYRNFETKDESRNIIPLGIWIVGEELHNNHHADPRSAKFKAKWYEFDIGWMYIQLLAAVRLAKVIYARNVTAREFAEKYYRRASEAATEVSVTASTAARRAQEAAAEMGASASAAARRAHDAAAEMGASAS
ncbi:MAG TPA: fatty acid desaturase, partial [Longimicrobiales bacterium]|nr:fatty acid desaturase [Longimicrobiales bacterium]